MPNHVTNELIFRDLTTEQIASVMAKTINKDGRVDFEILLPTPLNAWQWNEGSNHQNTFPIMGMTWARENWSTKWNAYQCLEPEVSATGLTLVFDTAWSPPFGWLVAVFNSQKVSFEHNWFDEGSDHSNHAVFDYSAIENDTWGREPWVTEIANDDLHRHMHMLKYGVERFEDAEV